MRILRFLPMSPRETTVMSVTGADQRPDRLLLRLCRKLRFTRAPPSEIARRNTIVTVYPISETRGHREHSKIDPA